LGNDRWLDGDTRNFHHTWCGVWRNSTILQSHDHLSIGSMCANHRHRTGDKT